MAFSTLPRIVLGEILQRFLSESEFFLGFHLLPPERVGGSVLVGQKPDDNKPIL